MLRREWLRLFSVEKFLDIRKKSNMKILTPEMRDVSPVVWMELNTSKEMFNVEKTVSEIIDHLSEEQRDKRIEAIEIRGG